MATKDIQQAQRMVESAVAKRCPQLSTADRKRVVARILDEVARILNNGGQPGGIFRLENGKIQLTYLTVEEIGQQLLGEIR
jgi:hypothetical protein